MLGMVLLCGNLLMLLEILWTLEWLLAYLADVGFEWGVYWVRRRDETGTTETGER